MMCAAFSIPETTFLTDALWEIEDEIAKVKEYQNLTYRIEFRKKIWLQATEDENSMNVDYLVFSQSLAPIRNGFYDFELDDYISMAALQHHFFQQETLPKDLQ